VRYLDRMNMGPVVVQTKNNSLQWPESFPSQVLLFVNVQEQLDWRKPFSRGQNDLSSLAKLQSFHNDIIKLGLKPCYLLSMVVMQDLDAVRLIMEISSDGMCELGVLHHPVSTPPFLEDVTGYNSYSGNLLKEVELAKITSLTHMFQDLFHRHPRIYRAGRSGLGPNSPGILKQLGYHIDCSVRSWFDYKPYSGYDYSSICPNAFWLDEAHSLLELPMSTAFIGPMHSLGPRIYPLMQYFKPGYAMMEKTGLLQRVVMTPEGNSVAKGTEAVENLLRSGYGAISINMHSHSLTPGNSSYVRTKKDVSRIRHWLVELVNLLMEGYKAQAVLPSQLYEKFRPY